MLQLLFFPAMGVYYFTLNRNYEFSSNKNIRSVFRLNKKISDLIYSLETMVLYHCLRRQFPHSTHQIKKA